jgi:hypothetical protein
VVCLQHRRNYRSSLHFLGLPAPSVDVRLPDNEPVRCRNCYTTPGTGRRRALQ